MSEHDTDNITTKKDPWLFRFIDKTDLFVTVFWIVWALEMVYMSIFVDCNYLCFEVPVFVQILGAVITVILAIIIKRCCFSDNFNDDKTVLFYGWNAVGPLLYNLVFFALAESKLYDYSGVLLGGLFQGILRIFNIALAIIFLIVNAIIKRVRRKKEADGITQDPDRYKTLKRFLGIATLVVGLSLLIFGVNTLIHNINSEMMYNRESNNIAFKQEMEEHYGDINVTKSEVVNAVKLVEMLVDGKAIDQKTKDSFHFKRITISQDVLDKGGAELNAFLENAKLIKAFSEQDGAVYIRYFADDRTVHFAFPTQYIGDDGQTRNCTFVCKYDDNWNLKDMYILTEMLSEKTRK